MGDNTTLNWKNLDDELDRSRNDLGMGWEEVARAAGISGTMLRKVRKGQSPNMTERTKAALEKAVGWDGGDVDDALAGGSPSRKRRTTAKAGAGSKRADTRLAAVPPPTGSTPTATPATPAATLDPGIAEDAERELFERWHERIGRRFTRDDFWELLQDFATVRKSAIQGSRPNGG